MSQRKASNVIERLSDMITASEQYLETNIVEVQAAEVMRQDIQTFKDACQLLREAFRVTKH